MSSVTTVAQQVETVEVKEPVQTLPTAPLTPFRELQPFISCLVKPHEFEEALKSFYSTIYVDTKEGYFKHMKLTGGRHIRMKVDNIPEAKGAKEVQIAEELNFLPAGKIPFEFWGQIVEFFRQVMKLKQADYEAHAWILWEPTKGYYISVPKQTVSKAAVQFSYDQEALPPGATIVVDIHSHNTMGAFYSGTDNNNDKNGIYYSGVVGKITDKSYEWVMRFNMHDVKKTVTLSEIFDIKEEVPQVPKAWLDQVEVRTYTNADQKNGKSTGTPVTGSTEFPRSAHAFWTAAQSIRQTGDAPFPDSQTSLWDNGMHRDLQEQYDKLYPNQADNDQSRSDKSSENETAGKGNSNRHFNSETRTFKGTRYPETEGQLREEDADANDERAARFYMAQGEDLVEIEQDPVGNPNARDEAGDDARFLPKSENYDYNMTQYGEDVAEAYDVVDTMLVALEGCDDLLLDLINQSFHMLTESGQARIQTNGIG